MHWTKTLTVVGAHAEGEVGRVITGGVLNIPGETVLEKMTYLQSHDGLRQFVNYEPRGCAQMTTNLLLPPSDPAASAGFIPMQADGTHAMSGSNAMCVATVLLETGMVPMQEPETVVVLDTAAGLIRAVAQCADGRVERVSLDFVPSYAEHLDIALEVEGLGTLRVDVAFGGVFYVMPSARALGLTIAPDNARDLVELGTRIKAAAREQVSVQHPEIAPFNSIEFVMFTDHDDADAHTLTNATIMPPGRVDRSPCGTGTAARLAAMHAKGSASLGELYKIRSIIGSCFEASICAELRLGPKPAILPRVSGRAWIYAMMQLGSNPSDPFREGFVVSDTWGAEVARTP